MTLTGLWLLERKRGNHLWHQRQIVQITRPIARSESKLTSLRKPWWKIALSHHLRHRRRVGPLLRAWQLQEVNLWHSKSAKEQRKSKTKRLLEPQSLRCPIRTQVKEHELWIRLKAISLLSWKVSSSREELVIWHRTNTWHKLASTTWKVTLSGETLKVSPE